MSHIAIQAMLQIGPFEPLAKENNNERRVSDQAQLIDTFVRRLRMALKVQSREAKLEKLLTELEYQNETIRVSRNREIAAQILQCQYELEGISKNGIQ